MKKLTLFLFCACFSAGMYATDYYVDGSVGTAGTGASWDSPFKTIAAAVSAATGNGSNTITDNIYIKEGSFNEKINLTVTNTEKISVFGSYAAASTGTDITQRSLVTSPTILDGGGVTIGPAFSVSKANGSADGLIIQNFKATGTSQGTPAGVQISISTAVVSNCIIRNNTHTSTALKGSAGGVYMTGGTLQDSEIYGNVLTGTGSGAVNLMGGGIQMIGGNINRCKIYNNSTNGVGGGIFVGKVSTSYPVADYLALGANVTISNCAIYNNAKEGILVGLLNTDDKTVTLTNNTIANNESKNIFIAKTGIDISPTYLIATNNIFSNNGAVENFTILSSMTYNAINMASNSGTNIALANTNTAAGFVSPSGVTGYNAVIPASVTSANWNLEATSVCKDAGNGSGNGTTDIAGSARVYNSLIDMGAYESQAVSGGLSTPTVTVTPIGTYTYNGNPQGPIAATNTGTGTSYTFSYVGTGGTSYTESATLPTNAGTYTATATVAANGAFNSASSIATEFTISKASPSISVSGTQSFTYTGAAQGPATISYSADGTTSLLYTNTDGVAYSSATAPTNAGNYKVVASATSTANNNAATSADYTFSISKVALTITATGPSKIYGTTLTAGASATNFTAGATGVGSEAVTSVTLTPDAAGLSAATAAGAAYTVTPSLATGSNGFLESNYNITYATYNGTVTAAAANKIGGDITALGLTDTELANTDVTITSGELVVNTGKTVRSITVNGGAKLTVPTGQTLILTNLTLKSHATNGTSTYVPEGTGTLTVTGTTNVEQYLATTRNWYVSSPVSNANAPAGYTYYRRDESLSNLGWVSVSAGAGLVAGKGYIALPSTAGVPITFTTQSGGTLNTGNVTIPITYTSDATSGKGYNLIGNPYPSHLSWTSAFATANAAKIDASIWYRTNSSGSNATGWSFVTYNPITGEAVPSIANGGIIPPMQAFWVLAKETGSIQFTNDMRSHQTGNPLKAPATKSADRKKLRLQVSFGTRADEALIVFDANAADLYDVYDSPKMMNNVTDMADIYTVADAKNLAINSMSTVKYNTEIPVGFSTRTAGDFSFSLSEFSNFETGTRVILKDTKYPTTEVELTPETAYNFSAPITAANANRFSLLFRAPGAATGVNTVEKLNAQVFVNAANRITIVAPEKANYAVYNAVGMMLEKGQTTAELQTVNYKLQTGVYVVRVSENGKELTTRVIIK